MSVSQWIPTQRAVTGVTGVTATPSAWFGPPKGLVRVRFSRRPAVADELTLRAGALSLPLAEGGSGRVFRWPVEGAPWPVGAEVELRLTRAAGP